jgi:polar amino acid transport system substrate-binding protein
MQDGHPDFMRRLSIAWGVGGLAAAAVSPDSAQAQPAAAESRLDTVLKRGRLLVATFSTNPPVCFIDEGGKPAGFDIDIARLIARGLLNDESKVDFITVDSSGRWPAVLSGRADFGIAATTIYPDRAIRIAFTSPYMDSGISILVRKDTGITTLAELNAEKYTLANLSNPQMADRAKRFVPKARLITFEEVSAMMLAVKSGQAQAMQMDKPVLDWYAARDETLAVLSEPFGNIHNNAMFLKPGDFPWWLYLSTIVGELRSGSRYDEYTALFRRWFGRPPPPPRFYAKS